MNAERGHGACRRIWRGGLVILAAAFGCRATTPDGVAPGGAPAAEVGSAVAGPEAAESGETPFAGVVFADELNVVPLAMERHPAGLLWRDIEVGTGTPASPGREVRLRYIAYLPDGTEVDRTPTGGAPLAFTLGNGTVIRGWDLGVRGMRVGGTRQLVVPPRLAYGRQRIGRIPPNATLVFVVRLERVG